MRKITRRLTCLNTKTLNIFINQIHIFFKYIESVFVCVYINKYIYIYIHTRTLSCTSSIRTNVLKTRLFKN